MRNNHRVIIISAIAALILPGCAEMYGKPEDREAANRATADYVLCEKLIVQTGAPSEIRNEWALELQRRSVNCEQYAASIHATAQRDMESSNELIRIGQEMMQPKPLPGTPPQGGGVATGMGFYKREYISGHNKICIYNRLGSEVAITIGAAQLCPLSIR